MSENKQFLYAPLELNSSFSEGEMLGGLGMIQVIRYTESPVGPYDELVVVPGGFEWEDAKKTKKRNVRVTRIYVSQKATCWNGRKSEFGFYSSLVVYSRFFSPRHSLGEPN
jgi:hypothetical protein